MLHAIAVEHGSLATPSPNVSDADLADDQLAAVTHAGGAARVIAPAGSGKTRVLTERARHLVNVWNLPSSAVALVAFNKRAQLEMTERTADLPGLHVRTLNSLALAIVNGSAMRDKNGYELNSASVIGPLVYGKGDFAETLRMATPLESVTASMGSSPSVGSTRTGTRLAGAARPLRTAKTSNSLAVRMARTR